MFEAHQQKKPHRILARIPAECIQFLTKCQFCSFAWMGSVFHDDNLILIYQFLCSFVHFWLKMFYVYHINLLLFLQTDQQKLVNDIMRSSSRNRNSLHQRWSTGGPRAGSGARLDLLRPPPSHRFGSSGESFNICSILLGQRKI
jgi:hypothetical protein